MSRWLHLMFVYLLYSSGDQATWLDGIEPGQLPGEQVRPIENFLKILVLELQCYECLLCKIQKILEQNNKYFCTQWTKNGKKVQKKIMSRGKINKKSTFKKKIFFSFCYIYKKIPIFTQSSKYFALLTYFCTFYIQNAKKQLAPFESYSASISFSPKACQFLARKTIGLCDISQSSKIRKKQEEKITFKKSILDQTL